MDSEPLVFEEGELFAVFDGHGDIIAAPDAEMGMYFRGARHLSHSELRIDDVRPVLLGSSIDRDDTLLVVDLCNPALGSGRRDGIAARALRIARRRLLWHDACLERLEISNHSPDIADFSIRYVYDADFADRFERRRTRWPRRGERLPIDVTDAGVTITYLGLDERVRTTRLTFEPPPDRLSPTSVGYTLSLAPGESRTCFVKIDCGDTPVIAGDATRRDAVFDEVPPARAA